MAAPTNNLFGTATTGAANSDTLTCAMSTMASGALVGDVINVFCASDGAQAQSVHASSAAGWTKIAQQNETGSSAVNIALYEYTVTSAGVVGDLVVDMGATTEMAVAHIFRIRPSSGATITRLAPTSAAGSSANPNPSSISNSTGGAIDAYFIAAFAGDTNIVAGGSTAAPTNYGNHQTTVIASSTGTCAGTADRTITGWANGSTEDPGTFTRASEQWAAMTVAYYETGGGGGSTGTLAATETGSDTFAATGTVLVQGPLAASETGSDTFAATGSVLVKGPLAASETGSDTFAANGSVRVAGSLAASETGSDTFAASGALASQGSLAATETGSDTFAADGDIPVQGTLAATETGSDTFAAEGAQVIEGTMAATETGSDRFLARETAQVGAQVTVFLL